MFSPGHGASHDAEHQALAQLLTQGNSGYYNYIINGDASITQRLPAGGGAVANLQYIVDRWQFIRDGSAGTVAMGQIAFTPGVLLSGEPTYFVRINQSVAGTTQTFKGMQQKIENVQRLSGQTVTVGFWARSSVATTITARLTQVFGTGGSAAVPTGDFSFSIPANVFTFCTFTNTLPGLTGKTVAADSSTYLLLFDQSANGGAIQVLDFTQVSLVVGRIAIPYALLRRSTHEEQQLCMRYYQKSFPYGTAPAQNAGVSGVYLWNQTIAGAVAQDAPSFKYPVPMFQSPTLTLYNPSAANAQVRNLTAGADCTATTLGSARTGANFHIFTTPAAGTTVGQTLGVHWTAEAEVT